MEFKKLSIWALLLSTIAIVGVSCKKYTDPPPVFEEYGGDTTAPVQRKVLIISVDGLSGEAFKKIGHPNMAELQKHGKFSYQVKPMVPSTDASTWATMLTGRDFSQHQIQDSSFMTTPSGTTADEDAEISHIPLFTNYVLEKRPLYQIGFVTPWDDLGLYTRSITNSVTVSNDEEVRDTAISMIENMPFLGLMFVDFNAPDIAGTNGVFSASNANYRNAVIQTDQYVGDVVEALKARKNFNGEDWLIIVTSNRGGTTANPQPGFMIVNNPPLEKEELKKHGYQTIRFNDWESYAEVPNDKGLYDAGKNGEFTVQLQVMFNSLHNWPGFFSKSTNISGQSSTGWTFVENGGKCYVVLSGLNKNMQAGTGLSSRWNTLTFRIKNQDGKRIATTFQNGEKVEDKEITGMDLSTSEGLRIGYRDQDDGYGGGKDLDFSASNILYFDTALPDSVIKKNVYLKDITKHPYYNDLIGYWPMNKGHGKVLENHAPKGYDMKITGSNSWYGLGIHAPRTEDVAADASKPSIIPSLKDISTTVFYWLQIKVKDDWNLNGNAWLKDFEGEIYNVK